MSGFIKGAMNWLRGTPARKRELTAAIVGSERGKQMAVLTVSGGLRDAMVTQYRQQWANTGALAGNSGKVAPGAILSVLGASGGGLGMSALASGQLFVATANPATLMAIGNGVGSAVVGAGGTIVAQAPFVAAAGAIVPVVVPVVIIQALTALLVMRGFASIRKDLATIEKALERVLHRSEVTFASELVSIAQRLESLEAEYSDQQQFSTEMIVRLALLEERVSALCERYKLLRASQSISDTALRADLDFKVHDSRLATVASSLMLRVGYLRLALLLQESPAMTHRGVDEFLALCDQHDELLKVIKTDDDEAEKVASELKSAVAAMSWWQRNVPDWLLGSRTERVRREAATDTLHQFQEKHKALERQEVLAAEALGGQARRAVTESNELALVYWKDELGEHSFYVDALPYEIRTLELAS